MDQPEDREIKMKQDFQRLTCRVYLVREDNDRREIRINNADDVYNLVKDELGSSDREVFLSILLTTSNTLIGIETVAIGTLNSCITTPREVFKSAILANAESIVLCHNHPSGSLSPSSEDMRITGELVKSGELLGIKIIDHILISHEGYKSLIHDLK